jgi:hypothetical protein
LLTPWKQRDANTTYWTTLMSVTLCCGK